MRAQLLTLARQIARAIRWAMESEAATEDTNLRDALPAPRLWALSVVLASWHLSKPERNRAEIAQLLTGSGVPSFWPQLDLFAPQLDPFVEACHLAQSSLEVVEASLRFFDAVHKIGPSLVRQVVKSRDFRKAAEVIGRNLPESDGKPQPSPKPKPQASAAKAGDWHPGGTLAEREEIATGYLTLLGWPRADVERFLGGKR